MPPVSEAQRRFMHAAANDPKFAKKAGIKQSVAKEFANADKPGKLPERKSDEDRIKSRYGGNASRKPQQGRGS